MYGYLRLDDRHGRAPLAQAQCALCHQLGASYRTRARWLAGDDPAVLALLLDALAPESRPAERVRCPLPGVPRRRALAADAPALAAVAALQLFLAGEKLYDDRVDRDGWLPRAAERLLRNDIAAACASLAALGFPLEEVRATLRAQPRLEADPAADLDTLASPTASALAASLAWLAGHAGLAPPTVAALATFAERLGRLLYLVDALTDHPRDLRRGRFNPIAAAVGPLGPAALRYVEGALEGHIAALAAAFDALPLHRNAPLLRAATVESLTTRGRDALARLPGARRPDAPRPLALAAPEAPR